MQAAGFVDGQNITVEVHWAEGHYGRLPPIAADLVRRRVALIVGISLPAVLAAKAATSEIPTVFVMGADPVRLGVVASFGRPGANITGVTSYFGALGSKRLELLRELVPSAVGTGILSNPKNPNASSHLSDILDAARALGQETETLAAQNEDEIERAFTTIAERRIGALLLADDPLFTVQRDRIIALAARQRVPTSYYARHFVVAGGLIGYGSDREEGFFQVGQYAANILTGASPAELPVLQPTRFELAINLRTARALGLKVPPQLLVRADEVIE